MPSTPKRRTVRTQLVLAGVVALAATSVVAIPAQAKTTDTATSKDKWERVSTGQIHGFTTPSLVRLPGNRLVAGWSETGSSDTLHTAVISGANSSVTARGTISDPWSSFSSSPQLVAVPGGVLAAYAGIHSTITGDPLNGPVISSSSPDGVTWTQDPTPISGSNAGGTYGLGVVLNGAEAFTGFIPTSTDTIYYHNGHSTFGATDNTAVLAGPGGDVFGLSLERDSATGAIYSTWYTLGGPNDGIHAQQVYPALGPVLTAPGATTAAGTVLPAKDIAITTTSKGGIWIGYGRGYPSATSVRAWNPETGKTVTVATGQSHVTSVDLSAGPDGKVWASWIDGQEVRASRSDSGVSEFGAIASLNTPGDISASTVTGEGSAGSLDVFVNSSVAPAYSTSALYHATIDPALVVSVSKSVVSTKKGAKLTFHITDAGDAVSHATLKYSGKTYHANSRGKVVVKVKKGTSTGTKKFSATKSGFLSTVTTLKVKK